MEQIDAIRDNDLYRPAQVDGDSGAVSFDLLGVDQDLRFKTRDAAIDYALDRRIAAISGMNMALNAFTLTGVALLACSALPQMDGTARLALTICGALLALGGGSLRAIGWWSDRKEGLSA